MCVSLVLYWEEPGVPALPEQDQGTGEQPWSLPGEEFSLGITARIIDEINQKFETPSPELHLF